MNKSIAINYDDSLQRTRIISSPCCIWLTGLPGSGKTTIANHAVSLFQEAGYLTYTLDGDNIRLGLNKDLSFSRQDRAENIRRVTEVAKLMVDAGVIVLVSLVSPYKSDRQFARNQFSVTNFLEIYISSKLIMIFTAPFCFSR